MASNWAVLQPQSYPCRIATAPMYRPSPKIDFSMPSVSLRSLMESMWRILLPPSTPTQILINPSALPSSLSVTKLLAVILKKGPNVWSWRSSFCALDASSISDMLGMSASLLAFAITRGNLLFWMGDIIKLKSDEVGVRDCEIGIIFDEIGTWILVWVAGFICRFNFMVGEAQGNVMFYRSPNEFNSAKNREGTKCSGLNIFLS